MESGECAEIIKRHPELILVSNQPVTWEGMLGLPVNLMETNRVRIKLTIPNFPRFNDAQLRFGKNATVVFRKNFNKRMKNLLQSAVSISSFLRQLQVLIGEAFGQNSICPTNIDVYSVISELDDVMRSSCEVRLSQSEGLSLVELVLRDICVKLKSDPSCADKWKIVSSDVGQLQGSELAVGTTITLCEAAKKLEHQVESLEFVWEKLRDIDRSCWVIDPLVPQPHHLYRRIKVTQYLSLLITIDPTQPSNLPDIKILGSGPEVNKYREIVSEKFELWNPINSLSENLLLLLDLQEFAQPDEEELKHKNSGLFDAEECGICYALKLNDEELPNIVCNNLNCRKNYHTECLRRWLQTIPGNQVVFNQIYGTCEYCCQKIACPVE
ncbi:E3 ubiquitin-protein ligase FANCL [Athalia rosae]|uniref:E3 ubiquitin-protein ligase FANCL n=1 Tax=Athalia rosae TaxID=37344 RepID=UPI0020339030|nr:E3 ubiquitin-protein ligase FANCL [Athalia rosae]